MKVFQKTLPICLVLMLYDVSLSGDGIPLTDCVVSLKEQVHLPARQSGVLVSLSIREGSRVQAGERIGKVDDVQQRLAHDLAIVERMESAELANSDVDVRFAQASAQVANAELQASRLANNRVDGTVPLSEFRRLELAASKAGLMIERSQSQHRIAGLTLKGRDLALKLAQQKVADCEVESPISGEVMEIQKQPGEWVQPGDTIAHIVRLDQLRVEGFVSASQYDPAEVADQPVLVTVRLAQGKPATFTGKIVYVRPVVQGGGQFLVHADVVNRSRDGHWLLRPGMVAEMTIGGSLPSNDNAAALEGTSTFQQAASEK